MSDFVLVPGAWLGAWAWDDVVPLLRSAGHCAHPLTLSGLAEKKGVPAGQQTHVQDIVDMVEAENLHEVVLVGHSYAGIPVGQAAERIGDRLSRIVFVDSEVPIDGQSFAPPGSRVANQLTANDGYWPVPAPSLFDGQGLSAGQVARILEGATPHPGAPLTEPAELKGSFSELPTTYVKCLLDGEELLDEVTRLMAGDRWRLAQMDTGHWPMFSQPRELAAVLLAAA